MRRTDLWLTLPILACAVGCKCEKSSDKATATAAPTAASLAPAAVTSPPVPAIDASVPKLAPEPKRSCRSDMVLVDNRYCVDRYELTLVDDQSGQSLSPHYPVLSDYREFLAARQREAERLELTDAGSSASVPMPELPEFQSSGSVKPKATSRARVLPNGHLTMAVAKAACENAGKRLCLLEEWRHACRGEKGEKFPYGPDYRPRQCNVFREEHPGRVLFGNFSVGMQDPRMGTVEGPKGPLLRSTGETASCASRWGNDAIYDMVGNLDEWVDEAEGTFVGGFFSRGTKEGCDTIVTAHGASYRDYSLGARCCKDAK